jgi:hypothetical protein
MHGCGGGGMMGFDMAEAPQPDKEKPPRNRRAEVMRGSKHRSSSPDTRGTNRRLDSALGEYRPADAVASTVYTIRTARGYQRV